MNETCLRCGHKWQQDAGGQCPECADDMPEEPYPNGDPESYYNERAAQRWGR